MKRTIITGLAIVIALVSQTALADGDKAAGQAKAAVCAACHGPKGISVNPMYPNLAGQKAAYIEAQLQAFQSGARNNPIMKPMAATLSADDIKNVAAYFSSLHCGDD